MKYLLAIFFLNFSTGTLASPKAPVSAENPYIYAPLVGGSPTAGYVTFKNNSEKDLKIKIMKVEPFKAVELHETLFKDNRMTMKKVEELSLPAGQELQLAPGGHHIMLFEAQKPVKEGDTLKAEFLVDGKKMIFDFKVTPRVSP